MMPYILIADIKGLNYYVQQYKGEIRLNGLMDNAIVFQKMEDAKTAAYTFGVKIGHDLTIRAIPPFEQSNSGIYVPLS